MRRIERRRSTQSAARTLVKIGAFEVSFRSFIALLIFLAIARNFIMLVHQQHSLEIRNEFGEKHNGPMDVENWLLQASKISKKSASSSAAEEVPSGKAVPKTPKEKVNLILQRLGNDTVVSENLRREDVNRDGPRVIHIVISHCTESISWFFGENLKTMSSNLQYSIKTITIISKCGRFIPYEDLRISCSEEQPLVTLMTLPNNGRNDHSFAYWITSILSRDQEYRRESNDNTDHIPVSGNATHEVLFLNDIHVERCIGQKKNVRKHDDPFQRIADIIDRDDLVIFMKDNNNVYRTSIEASMPLKQVIEQTLYNNASHYTLGVNEKIKAPTFPRGVACGSIPHLDDKLFEWTSWAHRSILWSFHLNEYRRKGNEKLGGFQSPHRPMGNWILYLASLGNQYDDPLPIEANATEESKELPYKPIFSDEYLRHAVSKFDPDYTPPSFNMTKTYMVPDIVPICFGGVFSSQWGQIASPDAAVTLRGWKTIAAALTREDNLEEGHYMERWWMDVLSWSTYNRDNWGPVDDVVETKAMKHAKLLAAAAASSGKKTNDTHYEALAAVHGNNVRVRTSTVSSDEDQKRLLNNKARHFALPSPYTGVILLFSHQIRQRSAILSGWDDLKKRKNRKKKKRGRQHPSDKSDDHHRNETGTADGVDDGSPAGETAMTDFERMRDERHQVDHLTNWWVDDRD